MFKGTFFAQIISIIGALLLAKIYGSEAYGVFGIYISISSILAIINTLQLDTIIVVSKTKKKGIELINSFFFITIFISASSFILHQLFSVIFEFKQFEYPVLIFSFLASILFSFNRIHEAFFTFRKKFTPISSSKIYLSFFTVIFQFILFYKFKVLGLIFGNIISTLLITVFYFVKNKKYISTVKIHQIKKCVLKNNSIIKYIFPSTLINSLAVHIMPILIVTFFSLEESGVYFLSLKILAIPLFLISSSISQVYYQKASEMFLNSKEKLFGLTKKIVLSNLGIMLLFILLINTIGIYFLELLFDKNWDSLRLFTFILSFLILARSSFNPISNIILVLNKNHISLIFNCYLLIVNLIAIYMGYLSNSLINTMIILSTFCGFGYIVLLFYFLNELKILQKGYE